MSVGATATTCRRSATNFMPDDIVEADITIMEVDEHFAATNSESASTNEPASRQFQDVAEVDAFAKAKVTNFLNRLRKGSGVTTPMSPVEVVPTQGDGASPPQYHGKLAIDFPAPHGMRMAEGVAENEKDAELLTYMHAEYLIDALGFQLYGLASSQLRHVAAAVSKGRWAASPGTPLADPSTATPPPLRFVKIRQPAAGVKHHSCPDLSNAIPVGEAPPGFAQLHLTLASTSILDPGSVQRLKHYLRLHGTNIQKLTRVLRLTNPADKGSPAFVATLRVPLPAQFGQHVASGKAQDRLLAVTLACMHAELIIDAVGAELHPDSAARQQQHADEAAMVGRWATCPGDEHSKPHSEIPRPLVFHPEAAAAAISNSAAPAGLAHLLVRYANATTVPQIEWSCMQYVGDLFGGVENNVPFVAQQLGSTHRCSLVIPVPSSVAGTYVAIGIADSEDEARCCCAMHALHLIAALNIAVYTDAKKQQDFATWGTLVGIPAAEPTKDATALPLDSLPAPIRLRPSPGKSTGLIKVSHTKAQKYAEMREVRAAERQVWGSHDAEDDALDTPIEIEDVTASLEATRKFVASSVWNLAADNADGSIMVHPSTSVAEKRTLHHTLYSPRVLDSMARARLFDYMERFGVPRASVFTRSHVTTVESHGLFRCTAVIPVPPAFGRREATGEAPLAVDAESLCAMHAELILDTLGLPLFDHVVLQRRHAKAARSMGRYAPMPTDEPAPPSTPSPPFLRQERQDSLRWLRFVQKTKGKAATVDIGPSEGDGTSREALSQLTAIRPDEIDPLANVRVGKYLFRHSKSLTADVVTTQVGREHANSMFRSQLVIPMPTPEFGVRIAVGVSNKRAESIVLCCMHAERVIDSLGIQLHSDRAHQMNHYHIAKSRGRSAPHPDDGLPCDPAAVPTLPGFQNVVGGRAPDAPQVPEDVTDVTAWNVYCSQVRGHLQSVRSHDEAVAIRNGHCPRQGTPWVNGLLDRVEGAAVDYDAKRKLEGLYQRHGLKYFPRFSITARREKKNAFLATMPLVPLPLTAIGFGHSRRDAIARAAMLALEALTRALPAPPSRPIDQAPQATDASQDAETLWGELESQIGILEGSFCATVRASAAPTPHRLVRCTAKRFTDIKQAEITTPLRALAGLAAEVTSSRQSTWPDWEKLGSSTTAVAICCCPPEDNLALVKAAVNNTSAESLTVVVCGSDIEAARLASKLPGCVATLDAAALPTAGRGLLVATVFDLDTLAELQFGHLLQMTTLVVACCGGSTGEGQGFGPFFERWDQWCEKQGGLQTKLIATGFSTTAARSFDIGFTLIDGPSGARAEVPERLTPTFVPVELVNPSLDSVIERIRAALPQSRRSAEEERIVTVICDDLGTLREMAARLKAQLPMTSNVGVAELTHPNDESGARRWLRSVAAGKTVTALFATSSAWDAMQAIVPVAPSLVVRVSGNLVVESPLLHYDFGGKRDPVSTAVAAVAAGATVEVAVGDLCDELGESGDRRMLLPFVSGDGKLTSVGLHVCLNPGTAHVVAERYLRCLCRTAPKGFDTAILARAADLLISNRSS